MSFLYPTGVAGMTGYSGLASFMAARIGTVTGSSGSAAPAVPTGNDGFLQALAQSVGAVGWVSQSAAQSTASATKTTNTWEDCPGFASWTFVAPMAKTYLVHVDLEAYDAANLRSFVFWRLDVNGVTYTPSPNVLDMYANHAAISFRVPVPMAAGDNVIKLQWNVLLGTGGVASGTDGRAFTVTG